jgi:hypothetical protein
MPSALLARASQAANRLRSIGEALDDVDLESLHRALAPFADGCAANTLGLDVIAKARELRDAIRRAAEHEDSAE